MNTKNKDSRNYYENFDWQKANLKDKIDDKIKRIIELIPHDVNSIIDIGCGDGTITNALSEEFNTIGVDRSLNAVKLVEKKKAMVSADNIPFKDNQFDLVFSSEMLEHLPDQIYNNTILEIKRIAKKYVFLTFPDDENIEKSIVRCVECGSIFNKSYHLRRLNSNIITKEFNNYDVLRVFNYGTRIRPYNQLLSKIKHQITPADSWIPPRWTKNITRKTMCPNCGKSFTIPYKFNLISFLCDSINILISPKREYQICVLLKKREN